MKFLLVAMFVTMVSSNNQTEHYPVPHTFTAEFQTMEMCQAAADVYRNTDFPYKNGMSTNTVAVVSCEQNVIEGYTIF